MTGGLAQLADALQEREVIAVVVARQCWRGSGIPERQRCRNLGRRGHRAFLSRGIKKCECHLFYWLSCGEDGGTGRRSRRLLGALNK